MPAPTWIKHLLIVSPAIENLNLNSRVKDFEMFLKFAIRGKWWPKRDFLQLRTSRQLQRTWFAVNVAIPACGVSHKLLNYDI